MKRLLIILLCPSFLFAQPTTINHSPNKNSIAENRNPNISIEFSESILPASINDTTFMVYGRWTGVHTGATTFENGNTKILFNSNKDFNAGEPVTVSLSKSVKNENDVPMGKGFTFQFMIPTELGTFQLTQIDQINVREDNEGHIQVYGAFAGDLNEDGWTDFTVPNEISNDVRVFLNDAAGGYSDFTAYSLNAGSAPSTNEGADFNLDGHIDFAVGNAHDQFISVFFGNGNGEFYDQNVFNVGVQIRGLTVMELNGDGFSDIVTANRVSSDIAILINKGDGTFEEEIIIDGNTDGETACMSADANNDGILDLFVGSYNSMEISLLLGDGEGNLIFSNKVAAGGRSWMIAAGDVNGDGFADVVSANSTGNNFSVVLSNGDGTLSEASVYPSGNFPLAIDLGYLDGDNDLDIVLSNYLSSNFEIYENDGEANFTKVYTLQALEAGSCAVLHDRDNDGDLDVTGIDELADVLLLFDNDPGVVSVSEASDVPNEFVLHQNYPNPFNPTTKIKYAISTSPRPSPYQGEGDREGFFVSLVLFDILGNQVSIIVNEWQNPGTHEIEFDASYLPSGVYIYHLRVNDFVQTRKMMLLK